MDTTTKREIARQDLIHALEDMAACLRDQAGILQEKAQLVEMVTADFIRNDMNDRRALEILQTNDLGGKHEILQMKQSEITLRLIRLLKEAGYI